MRKHLWVIFVASVCLAMTVSCAASGPSLTVAPPQLLLPPEADRPCALAVLQPPGDLAALETAYMQRGAQIVACDAARQMAIDVLMAERKMAKALGR